MALSGLGLVGFLITHLLGNLTLYSPSSEPINAYAAKLESFGIAIEMAEVGLAGLFLLHILMALWTSWKDRTARPVSYEKYRSKGKPSKSTRTSRKMIVSGVILLAFLVLHVVQFKYGPSEEQGYVAQVAGQNVRDLHRLVVETFKQPLFVAIYVFAMLFLGAHLRHGFWSAFQSLGIAFPRYTKGIYTLGLILAVILAVGFLFIPIWIYFDLGGLLR
jgi:succinate dehydrogenase / fumarate reductase cytochrome b subunit